MTGTHELFYLAQPYWHDDVTIRNYRTRAAEVTLGYLGQHNVRCFSPIAHWAAAKTYMADNTKGNHAFWMFQDLPMLVRCDAMLILPLEGWQESRGLDEELRWAYAHSIPVLQLVGAIPMLFMPLVPNDTHAHVVCSHSSPQFPLLSEVPHGAHA